MVSGIRDTLPPELSQERQNFIHNITFIHINSLSRPSGTTFTSFSIYIHVVKLSQGVGGT
jgi:hypothetical protein